MQKAIGLDHVVALDWAAPRRVDGDGRFSAADAQARRIAGADLVLIWPATRARRVGG